MEDSEKRFRSPQFPFIPLEKCVARAKEFEAVYGQNAGRPMNVAKTWNYSEKSSGGIQTIAALSAFGLLEDEGIADARKLKLSALAMTILKDKRPGNAEAALKTAALRPRVINELWTEWGANRPPDHECLSILHLDKKFAEDAAGRLLKIYDATISYANLAGTDKKSDNEGTDDEAGNEFNGEGKDLPPPPPPPPSKGKVPLMENERILYAHNVKPDQGFKIIVFGEVDKELATALEAFAKFQVGLAKPASNAATKSDADPE